MFVKLLMILIFVVGVVAIGIYTRQHASSVDGFVLGGRNVGPWLSAFAYGTSYFSAVIFVGYAGQFGWRYGIASTWIGIGNALLGSLLAWYVMGPRTREMTQRLKASTMPQFFGARYKSEALRIVAAAIIFVFLIPYTASVYNGLSRLFGMAFGLPYEVCIVGMAIVTCAYVVLGGYMATVVNDFVQGIVMLVGIVAVISAVLMSNGGPAEAIATLSRVPTEDSFLNGAFVSFFGPDLFNLLGVVILTSLGTWGLPQMVTKFYAIKDRSAVRKGAIISTVFAMVVAGGSYFLGGFARLYGDQIEFNLETGAPVYDSIVPTMLSNLPNALIGIVIVLVLSASMSTLSSLVLTSSSTLTLDVIKPRIMRNMNEKSQLVCMRALLVVFVVISAGIALWQYNSPVNFIAQLMGISWGALAGAFLGPFLWGLYSNRISKAAVWASFVVGVGLTTSNMFLGFIDSPVNCGALAMLLSLVVVPLVSLITPSVDFDVTPRRRARVAAASAEGVASAEAAPAQRPRTNAQGRDAGRRKAQTGTQAADGAPARKKRPASAKRKPAGARKPGGHPASGPASGPSSGPAQANAGAGQRKRKRPSQAPAVPEVEPLAEVDEVVIPDPALEPDEVIQQEAPVTEPSPVEPDSVVDEQIVPDPSDQVDE
ncbi:MAG: sodium/solute symporter [Atopobiaceae bacterium]|nr:sodium/solute symporter [Atopobiaceae bacterium]